MHFYFYFCFSIVLFPFILMITSFIIFLLCFNCLIILTVLISSFFSLTSSPTFSLISSLNFESIPRLVLHYLSFILKVSLSWQILNDYQCSLNQLLYILIRVFHILALDQLLGWTHLDNIILKRKLLFVLLPYLLHNKAWIFL